MNNAQATSFAEEMIKYFWEVSNENGYVNQFLTTDFVNHNNNLLQPVSEIRSRLSHNAEYYQNRTVTMHDVIALDGMVINKFNLAAIDAIDNTPFNQDFVEIYKMEKNRIKEAWIMGDLAYGSRYAHLKAVPVHTSHANADVSLQLQIAKLQDLLNRTNNNVKLSKQQTKCLLYTLQGYTAKEIAKFEKKSFRTIESYIDIVKNKYDCRDKKELIRRLLPTGGMVMAPAC